jgi:hypothetical protein
MRIGYILICLTILLSSRVEAGASVMRGDYYDPSCYSVGTTTPSSCTQPSKEIRYYTLANGPRFAAVGAFVLGTTTASASGVNPRFCSGTVIGLYTVITAAHCFNYPPDGVNFTHAQLEGISFILGPDTLHPTERMRMINYQLAAGWNPTTLQNDYALVQVYDDTTFGAVATPGVQLYGLGTENDGLSFPVGRRLRPARARLRGGFWCRRNRQRTT